MSIPCAVLMCHAPIVIPAVAGARARDCARTTEAMRKVAERLVAHAPDVLVVVSPHAPRDPVRWGVVDATHIEGDFGRFGVPNVGVVLPGAPQAAEQLAHAARSAGLATRRGSGRELDHGTLVPLWFVHEAGWRGPTLVVALPFPGTGTEPAMGRAIAAAASAAGERWAVLASGDMSHRLTPDAPAGYDPRARTFDARFRDLVAAGALREACAVDPELRELAAEDVVDSCAVAAGAVGFDTTGHEVLSYEGPFGVGYLEAVIHEAGRPSRPAQDGSTPPRALLRLAREAIAAFLERREVRAPMFDEPWSRSRGVFVTLRTQDGELRGCVGHIEPVYPTLAAEVASCAVSSAVRDTRFSPVDRDELDTLSIELSVLGTPEAVDGIDALDPNRYGVVVSQGTRRGVLLPSIEGIDSAAQQVDIAARKGGIDLADPHGLERFEVVKIAEEDG